MIASFMFITGVSLGIEFPPNDPEDTIKTICVLDLFIIRIVFEKVD